MQRYFNWLRYKISRRYKTSLVYILISHLKWIQKRRSQGNHVSVSAKKSKEYKDFFIRLLDVANIFLNSSPFSVIVFQNQSSCISLKYFEVFSFKHSDADILADCREF